MLLKRSCLLASLLVLLTVCAAGAEPQAAPPPAKKLSPVDAALDATPRALQWATWAHTHLVVLRSGLRPLFGKPLQPEAFALSEADAGSDVVVHAKIGVRSKRHFGGAHFVLAVELMEMAVDDLLELDRRRDAAHFDGGLGRQPIGAAEQHDRNKQCAAYHRHHHLHEL